MFVKLVHQHEGTCLFQEVCIIIWLYNTVAIDYVKEIPNDSHV